MKTAVVTSGAGFIGSHLCKHLLTCGHKVIAIDDLRHKKTKRAIGYEPKVGLD